MFSCMCSVLHGGCDIHSPDNAQNYLLHLAAGCGFLNAVVRLVELGADLNCRDMSDSTPLYNTAHGPYSALPAVPPGMAKVPLKRLGGCSPKPSTAGPLRNMGRGASHLALNKWAGVFCLLSHWIVEAHLNVSRQCSADRGVTCVHASQMCAPPPERKLDMLQG